MSVSYDMLSACTVRYKVPVSFSLSDFGVDVDERSPNPLFH